jgi:hypothetical protein
VSGGKVTPAAGVAGDIDDRISSDLTVSEISLRYLEYCDTYYRTPSGERTSTYGNALQAARALQLCAAALATPQRPHRAGLSEGESLTQNWYRTGAQVRADGGPGGWNRRTRHRGALA